MALDEHRRKLKAWSQGHPWAAAALVLGAAGFVLSFGRAAGVVWEEQNGQVLDDLHPLPSPVPYVLLQGLLGAAFGAGLAGFALLVWRLSGKLTR